MKKTLTTFLLIFAMLILLTGCVSVNYEVTINEDGSGKVAYIYAYKKEYLQSMQTTSEELLSEAQMSADENGYTIEPYSDETYEGFKATKQLENVTEGISFAEIFGEGYVTDGENNNIKIDGKKYSQNASIDLSKMENMAMFGITMKYSVNLPTKVGENNATTVSEDGRNLTWDLKAGEINEIQFEATNSSLILIYILIGAIIIAAAVIIVAIIISKKQKGELKVEVDNHQEEIKENEKE